MDVCSYYGDVAPVICVGKVPIQVLLLSWDGQVVVVSPHDAWLLLLRAACGLTSQGRRT